MVALNPRHQRTISRHTCNSLESVAVWFASDLPVLTISQQATLVMIVTRCLFAQIIINMVRVLFIPSAGVNFKNGTGWTLRLKQNNYGERGQ